ncbi:MAG TPA: ribonuclease H-like domain-containing protein [Bacillota bacterium]|nr:ribonuclease H-like domain-containing protein [Bacillota bacterium]
MTNREIVEKLRTLIKQMEAKDGISPKDSYSPDLGGLSKGYEQVFYEDLDVRTTVETHCGFTVYTTSYNMGCFPLFYPVDWETVLFLLEEERSFGTDPRDNPDNLLFLDVETTGMLGAGTVCFLIGLGRWKDGGFEVLQYFLSDRDKEPLMLEHMLAHILDGTILVTFNGKCFDVPLLTNRFIMNGLHVDSLATNVLGHIDLYSLVRKLGRHPVYGYSLQESAARFVGTTRSDDISGHLIPALYFIYEQDQDISVLERVFTHNRLDVLDMVGLLRALGRIYLEGPEVCDDPFTLSGVGRFYLRKGNVGGAKEYMLAAEDQFAVGGIRGRASEANMRQVATLLRKEGNWADAATIWKDLIQQDAAIAEDYLWLARYYELVEADIETSIQLVEQGITWCAKNQKRVPDALMSRKRRLEKLLSKKGRPRE